MTAASELKSAAVVELERKTSKTEGAVSKTPVKTDAVKKDAVKAVQARTGSTTATVTDAVTTSTTQVASATAEKARSGNTAATSFYKAVSALEAESAFNAASMQATRSPVSVFFKHSLASPTTQQNPSSLSACVSEGQLRASRAA